MNNILDFFPLPQDLSKYFELLLTVSGTLFGLAFTALIFVFQNIIETFNVSRNMMLKLYVRIGKVLLSTLAYLMILSIVYLFLNNIFVRNAVYYFSNFLLVKYILDFYSQYGYQHTLFFSAFCPSHYKGLRKYIRYITNLGVAWNIRIVIELVIFIAIPIILTYVESNSFNISNRVLFYSSLLFMLKTIFSISSFLSQFYSFSKLAIENEPNKIDNDVRINYDNERTLLKKHLIDHGINEFEEENGIDFLDGKLFINFLERQKSDEAWFNIFVSNNNCNPLEIKNNIYTYSYNILQKIHTSQVDIQSFVLSFHIRLKTNEEKHRSIFIRTNRTEISNLLTQNKVNDKFIEKIDNKVIDELFRG